MLTLTPLIGLPLIKSGDNLIELIIDALKRNKINIIDGDVLVLAQKIISKSEGRMVNLATISPSPAATQMAQETEKDPRLVELILQESVSVLRTRPGTIVVEHRLGFVCANAGIDHSNVAGEGSNKEEWVLLLPENPDSSAEQIRTGIEHRLRVSIGVMIIDSHGRAWRMGTVGVAIGLAGLPGLVDMRGVSDLFGYTLRITQIGAADELAAAASLVMGQAAEATPVVHVHGFPYSLRDGSLRELLRPPELDMFR
jgi:coenzyme F420-0:L-glutamate ligase/coenzyme F420-1:gamma-L-glutamate ligase